MPILEAVAPERYDGIDHDRLIAYAVKILDDASLRATFEHVTVAAFRLFPNVFALAGYPEYPDAARVNRTLLHGGPKYRDYLTGRATTGYFLSTRGQTAAQETADMITSANIVRRHRGRAKAARTFSERMEREVRNSDAFRAWEAGREIQSEDFYIFLHLLPGSTKEAVRENFAEIRKQLAESPDVQIAAFITHIACQFQKEYR